MSIFEELITPSAGHDLGMSGRLIAECLSWL